MNRAMEIQVRKCSINDLDDLVGLFDGYRQFYGKACDLVLARQFLSERLQRNESVILIAQNSDGLAVGFTQLYPSFSSVSAARIFILNDLYVSPDARRFGVGVKLLDAAAQFGRSAGAIRMTLNTAIDNEAAQALYVSRGWIREDRFLAFNFQL